MSNGRLAMFTLAGSLLTVGAWAGAVKSYNDSREAYYLLKNNPRVAELMDLEKRITFSDGIYVMNESGLEEAKSYATANLNRYKEIASEENITISRDIKNLEASAGNWCVSSILSGIVAMGLLGVSGATYINTRKIRNSGESQ